MSHCGSNFSGGVSGFLDGRFPGLELAWIAARHRHAPQFDNDASPVAGIAAFL